MKIARMYEGLCQYGQLKGAIASIIDFDSKNKKIPSVGVPYVMDRLVLLNSSPRYVALLGDDPLTDLREILQLLVSLSKWVGSRGLTQIVIVGNGRHNVEMLLKDYRQLLTIVMEIGSVESMKLANQTAFSGLSTRDTVCVRFPDTDVGTYDEFFKLTERIGRNKSANPVVEITVPDVLNTMSYVTGESGNNRIVEQMGRVRQRFDLRVTKKHCRPVVEK